MRAWPIIVSLFVGSSAFAQTAPITLMEELIVLDECQLLELYKNSKPGPLPNGFVPGRVIMKPGSTSTVRRSNFMKHIWQGKYFDDQIMTNKIFGLKFIKGNVTCENSWFDGQPVHAIDYSETSLLFKTYRDEFREVAPGIYLGAMWKRNGCQPKLLTWFAFDARGTCCAN